MQQVRRLLGAIGVALALALLYLLLWPVPIDPVAWAAPSDRGFVVPYDANDALDFARAFDITPHDGPEDIAAGIDGHLYSTSADGSILRYDGRGKVELFASTGGRPLGIEAMADGSLVVANAYLGLQRIDRHGTVETLLDADSGQPLPNANDLAIGSDGTIYFSEASSKFSAASHGGSYAASLLDIMEHGGHGRLIAFGPDQQTMRILLHGLNYANGVAISDDQSFLLIAETGAYRILKHWLSGPDAGATEVLLDNLPAFPDNINAGRNGRFWIGLIAPRNALLDRYSGKPLMRKVLQRFPAQLRPRAVPHSQLIAINADGEVLMNLHDASARFPAITGALETADTLYLSSLFGQQLPYVRKQDL
ncbi:MAG: SMP-30/gluconolactonase/LRE family protein [Gammaproteobacteria bacterium]|nr:SMP-30/gluconolactonase/LRE family protein [Gammaproteobacteria bacterium]MDH5303991.1 SMP-30/gluconolactonase/LRE family protein [Gammaproteobacteria bacterium]MDH5321951.1 SMP-30/gluconolactonase/LRE family protein [Gammaproteobacteria bacterium]